ncbi:uncharacterized protein LOC125847225 [Solanum stenotomum]|uniref:uncharacterized protein LOC125847225 n=1 Tax=Solanum stenotomum TaxID=172797 RepID=UPI0020D10EFB|nr:uncharacterized protein LOC125847225 [Solanum stenotomum]
MIEQAILAALTPLRTSIDTLTSRVETCKSQQRASLEMKTLKADVEDLRKDVDYLKSTNFTSLFEAAEIEGVPGSSKIPPTTTGDVSIEDIVADESEAETHEEQLDAQEETIYGDQQDLKDTIV